MLCQLFLYCAVAIPFAVSLKPLSRRYFAVLTGFVAAHLAVLPKTGVGVLFSWRNDATAFIASMGFSRCTNLFCTEIERFRVVNHAHF
jgi:hypothetical protein